MKENNILAKVMDFLRYLFNKRAELQDLDYRDALLAQANIRIYRTTTHKALVTVPFNKLRPLHRLERKNAHNVLCERITTLKSNQEKVITNNLIKSDILNEYLPSVSLLRVIEDRKGDFIVFEGNGRVAALKEVFNEWEGFMIEVEQYHFKNNRSILRMLNKLRMLNGVLLKK